MQFYRSRLFKSGWVKAILVITILLPLLPASLTTAQGGAPPVLILPIDRAQFLPGSNFDMRVEVHAEELPADFSVTINGQTIDDFFGTTAIEESWTFGDEEDPTPSQSLVWRGVVAPAPGDYTVTVTAGGEETSVNWVVRQPQVGQAKNVILFIADGMSVPMITAARIMSRGIYEGKLMGEFAMDNMENIGLVHSSGMDSIITDSANSASAYNTGHKSAVNALGVYPDTSPETQDDPRQETLAELVKRTRDMSVGIVTTSNWTDATPAAVFAHTRRRGDLNDIAAMPLDEELYPEVILGGGARQMIPEDVAGGRREDNRNLFDEYEAAGYTVVTSAAEMEEVMSGQMPERLLGLFSSSHMNVWLDRNVYTDNLEEGTEQPGLVDMTMTALDILSQNENGFFLEVEAASVDKQMHPLDYERSLADLIEFDNAVAAAVEWAATNAPDTLIVVTADHGHGYDVYGAVDVEAFNAATDDIEKRAAIGTYADAGFVTYRDNDGDGFPDDWNPDRVFAAFVNNTPEYTEDYQVSPVPRVPAIQNEDGVYIDNPEDDPNGILVNGNLPPNGSTGVHTLQDVPVFASGPGSDFYNGIMDNTEVFFGIANALSLDPSTTNGIAVAAPEAESELASQ